MDPKDRGVPEVFESISPEVTGPSFITEEVHRNEEKQFVIQQLIKYRNILEVPDAPASLDSVLNVDRIRADAESGDDASIFFSVLARLLKEPSKGESIKKICVEVLQVIFSHCKEMRQELNSENSTEEKIEEVLSDPALQTKLEKLLSDNCVPWDTISIAYGLPST